MLGSSVLEVQPIRPERCHSLRIRDTFSQMDLTGHRTQNQGLRTHGTNL